MKDIPIEDLQNINLLNQSTWGWQIKSQTDRGDDYQKFTIQGIDPFTKTWHITDGSTIKEAVEKFIEIIGV